MTAPTMRVCDSCGKRFIPDDLDDDRENVCSEDCEAVFNGRGEE